MSYYADYFAAHAGPVHYYDAEGVPFSYDTEHDLALAYETDPPRRVHRAFRDDVRVCVEPDEFERLRRAA